MTVLLWTLSPLDGADSTRSIKLQDLWLQGGGFDPCTQRRVNNIWESKVKWHKSVSSIMKHICEVNRNALIHFLPQAIRARGDDVSVAQLWLQADPGLCLLSGVFSLYFWTRLLNGILIDCDPDQWLAVAGLLSQYWIYSVFLLCLQPALLPSFLVWDWRRFINEAQLPVLCLHTPVNVLSVS